MAAIQHFHDRPTEPVADLARLAEEADVLVRRWLAEAAAMPTDPSAERLADLLKDPAGLAFTVGFIDGVIRPEDPRAAAANMADLARDLPRFLPWHLRTAVRLGAAAGRVAPHLVIPVVRRALREMVRHLIVDATDARLGRAIEKIGRRARLNINLLGEAVLGEREAQRRLDGTRRLLARDDVDYVSIKVSSTVAPRQAWAFDETVEHVVERLAPLYRLAAKSRPQKLINLDMEEYRELDLTIAAFTTILDSEEFLDLQGGIALQAYLPDALGAMMRLQEWAAARRARGGAPIKVRVVKGANLPMERVEASLHGWPLATWRSKQDTDTNYKRVIEYALHPNRIANVRVGVAGHNLFDVAFAWLLAGRRGVRDGVEFEMLLGMAQGQAEAVRREVGGLLLYTPVVHPREFDVAIAYLTRRLEEGASEDNFMSAVFELNDDSTLFERERGRFRASLEALDRSVPRPFRTQDRRQPLDAGAVTTEFDNVPDTDPSLPGNRAWGRAILARVPTSRLGVDLVEAHTLTASGQVERTIATALEAAPHWGARPGAERAAVLRRVAVELERRRGDLIEVMAAECGKTIDQADPEVSEAIDFANYYASLAEGLDHVDGAVRQPVRLTVVTPPWNFPVSIPTGSTLAPLAAGSAVVVKPAPQARRCGSLMVEALWAAGVPREVLELAHVGEGDLGRSLVSDPRVDRLVLTGAYETAALFRSFRPDLPLLAETSGKNAIVVTPTADLDLAVKDVVASAFGHAGQKCSAASLAILVGSVATSRRFREQLVDAVTSLRVGRPSEAATQIGPVIEPASGKLLRALTTLGPGESWLIEPRRLDDEGRLWSPGVKTGVRRGSEYHLTEYFGPLLGIMTAETLEEAVEIQNEVDYGLTAGLHSRDADEIALWVDRVLAGNLYVNRGITGAIVRRQPFGGWKKSAVGGGAKAGGPNYLIGLTGWVTAPATAVEPIGPAVLPLLKAAAASLEKDSRASLERSLRSDAAAWAAEFGMARDVCGLAAERNVLRYVATPVLVRLSESGSVASLVRVVAAGVLARAQVTVSTGVVLPDALLAALSRAGVRVRNEDDAAWLTSASRLTGRVRLLGGDSAAVATATGGRPDLVVYDHPVTEAGRIEMLPFLREQAVSITAHRFGTPDGLADRALAKLTS